MIFLKKQFISGFICCLLLTFSINVLANYIYKAKDIEFNSSYTDMKNVEDAIEELYTETNKKADVSEDTIKADVLLNGYTAHDNMKNLITGTMPNNGEIQKNLTPGDNFSIPSGYTSGGKITVSSNTKTYTIPSNSTGTTIDLGEKNLYRYVNATNVYNKGVSDADARVNTSSTNYKTGYNNGVSSVNLYYNSTLAWDHLNNSATTGHNYTKTVTAPADGFVVIGAGISNYNCKAEIKINNSRVFYAEGGIIGVGRVFKVNAGDSIYVWLYGERSSGVAYPSRTLEITFYTK